MTSYRPVRILEFQALLLFACSVSLAASNAQADPGAAALAADPVAAGFQREIMYNEAALIRLELSPLSPEEKEAEGRRLHAVNGELKLKLKEHLRKSAQRDEVNQVLKAKDASLESVHSALSVTRKAAPKQSKKRRSVPASAGKRRNSSVLTYRDW